MRRIALLPLLLGLASAAAGAEIEDLQVALEGRQVLLSFRLDGAFDDALFDQIQAGLPRGFEFQFRLFRDHKRWFDGDIDGARLQVSAMYNALTDDYLVNTKHDGELIESRVVNDRESLERALTRFEKIPIFTLGDLPRDWRLLIRGRADLGPDTTFLLFPGRERTGWTRSRKFRAPEDRS